MLKVHIKHLGSVTVLHLQGRIVKGETDSLGAAVFALPGGSALILDFAQVTTVDACGLGVMLQLRAQAEAKGIRFALMNVSKEIRMVLAITRLDTVFEITSGVEVAMGVSKRGVSAVAAWRQPGAGRSADKRGNRFEGFYLKTKTV